jgi:poly(A) polymerase
MSSLNLKHAAPKAAAWLDSSATSKVMAALEAARAAAPDIDGPMARFVGGCVRNTLLAQAVDDIDIATPLTPQQTVAALEAAGLRVAPTGIEHGTVTAIADGAPFEITTLRRDVETDGRRAVVAFSTDWAEDAQRRDFRLNAIYADLDGAVFDPVGGVADARAGRVVFIGAADDRIREDYLRILRFFRFSAWYAQTSLDEEGFAACARHVDGMAGLSVERIWKELKKLLEARDPRTALHGLEVGGLLRKILPEAPGAAMLDRLIGAQLKLAPNAAAFARADAMPRFMALVLEAEAGARAAARLKMSNEEKERLAAGLSRNGAPMPPISERAARAALYRLGPQAFQDRLVLTLANAQGEQDLARFKKFNDLARNWTIPKMPIGGDDVLRTGVKAGPHVGAALRAAEEWWIENDFPADRKALLAKAQEAAAKR